MYFTPPILADRLIDDLIVHGASLTNHVWLDPACGGGAFLTSVGVRMIEAMAELGMSSSEIIEKVSTNLIGNDLDETLAFLSSQFLRMALYEQLGRTTLQPRFKIFLGDGLSSMACDEANADVIICNPPYRKMKSVEVSRYFDAFGDIIEGQPNIYGLFIRRCLSLGGGNSIVGLLTPTSYLSGRHFSKLRKFILRGAIACQLDLVDDRMGVFIGVSQGAVLGIYKRSTEKIDIPFHTKIYALSITGEFTFNGECVLINNSDAWVIPRSIVDQEVISLAASSSYRLKDYGYTPRIGAYVDYRDVRETYDKKPKNRKMDTIFPIIWSSDITTAGEIIHGRTSKKDCHHIYIEMGSADHPSIMRRPAVALQRVTSPDQPKRLVAAAISAEFLETNRGVVGENHVIFLEKTSENALVSVEELVAILSSEPIDRLFRSISGAVNVSISELGQLPLPNPNILAMLIRKGREIDGAVLESFYHF